MPRDIPGAGKDDDGADPGKQVGRLGKQEPREGNAEGQAQEVERDHRAGIGCGVGFRLKIMRERAENADGDQDRQIGQRRHGADEKGRDQRQRHDQHIHIEHDDRRGFGAGEEFEADPGPGIERRRQDHHHHRQRQFGMAGANDHQGTGKADNRRRPARAIDMFAQDQRGGDGGEQRNNEGISHRIGQRHEGDAVIEGQHRRHGETGAADMHADPPGSKPRQPVLHQGRDDESQPGERAKEHNLDRGVAVFQIADADHHQREGQRRQRHPESAALDSAAPVRDRCVRVGQSS